MVFSGWDYCIYNDQSAVIKHKALYYQIKNSLDVERKEEEKKHRTRDEVCRLVSVRLMVNFVIVVILAAAGSLVYFTFHFSTDELQRDIDDDLYKLLLEFLPSLCIIGLNLFVPTILHYLVSLERYSHIFAIRITLVRTILLRLVSLSVLLTSFYSLVKCKVGSEDLCVSTECRTPICWETYVARQIYKLLMLDIIFNALITLLINFPRMLLAKHVKCKLAQILGAQEFDVTKHMVDVVYTQTLVWLGSFYAPLLPALATLLFFVTFYLKKFACLVNSSPSITIYTVSRSKTMFMSVLLVWFSVALLPWAYTISEIEPSKSCGPFKGRPSVWSLIESTYNNVPSWFKYCMSSVTSAVIAVPAFIILTIVLYYYYIITDANRQLVMVLKKQLVLEGHDKQFLLNRLSAFIKQHQERHKVARSVDPPVGSN